jgi:hypothetical protein
MLELRREERVLKRRRHRTARRVDHVIAVRDLLDAENAELWAQIEAEADAFIPSA